MVIVEKIKPVIFAAAAFLVFFCLLELGSGFALKRLNLTKLRNRSVHDNIFEYDRNKVYGLKKNHKGMFEGKEVITNSFGHRDDEINIKKNEGEIRLLLVGDSVSFGHGVDAKETFSENLEKRLTESLQTEVHVINTGVPGYSAFQEYDQLKTALVYDPDLVIIQFVLNDVYEPYLVYKRYGGRGIDYHLIADTNFADAFLRTHSRTYYLAGKLLAHSRFGTYDEVKIAKMASAIETKWSMVAASTQTHSAQYAEAWREYFSWLKKMVLLCQDKNIPVWLMEVPYEFQIFSTQKQYAQKLLKEFSQTNGIVFIDELEDYEALIKENLKKKYGEAQVLNSKNLRGDYKNDIQEIWQEHFLDSYHFTPLGHDFTGRRLETEFYRQRKAQGLEVIK